jgi:hypothetical protein
MADIGSLDRRHERSGVGVSGTAGMGRKADERDHQSRRMKIWHAFEKEVKRIRVLITRAF